MSNDCFWCSQPAATHLQGADLCTAHAQCGACGKTVPELAMQCTCADYGVSAHEDVLFCDMKCLEAEHPDVEPDLYPEEGST